MALEGVVERRTTPWVLHEASRFYGADFFWKRIGNNEKKIIITEMRMMRWILKTE